MSYVPLKPINQAIGSPEADNLHTVPAIANDITFDKSVLVAALISFGVPANITESLIELINKVIPLSINYVELFTDFFADQTTALTGNSDSVTATLFSNVSPSPEPSESLGDATSSFTGDTTSGNVYTGGDATDTTKGTPFVIVNVINGTNLQIDSAAGMAFGDTIQQGVNSTTITNVIDITHIIVMDTTGFVASSLAATF